MNEELEEFIQSCPFITSCSTLMIDDTKCDSRYYDRCNDYQKHITYMSDLLK